MKKIRFRQRLVDMRKFIKQGVPLVLFINPPLLESVVTILHNHLCSLCLGKKIMKVFSPKSSRKPSSELVRAKLKLLKKNPLKQLNSISLV